MKFNQMQEALARVKVEVKRAEDVPEAPPRLSEQTTDTGPVESVREGRPTVGDRAQSSADDVPELSRPVRRDLRDTRPAEEKVLGVVIGECAKDTQWTDLGDVCRLNLCPTFWDEEIATIHTELLKHKLINDGFTRVLLLGTRVGRIWKVGHKKFGYSKIFVDGQPLKIAWIPHPKNLTDYEDMEEAKTYIEWVCGERKTP